MTTGAPLGLQSFLILILTIADKRLYLLLLGSYEWKPF